MELNGVDKEIYGALQEFRGTLADGRSDCLDGSLWLNGIRYVPHESFTKAKVQRDMLFVAAKKAEKLIDALYSVLYGQGLEVANWHRNGELQPMDSFFDDNASGDELEKLRFAIGLAEGIS